MLAKLIVRAIFGALGLWIASKLVHGIVVSGSTALILAALLLGVVNAVVRPVVTLLTLPLTILTLGLFLLVVNGIMILVASHIVPGFLVYGFAPAFWGAVVLALLGMVIRAVVKES